MLGNVVVQNYGQYFGSCGSWLLLNTYKTETCIYHSNAWKNFKKVVVYFFAKTAIIEIQNGPVKPIPYGHLELIFLL